MSQLQTIICIIGNGEITGPGCSKHRYLNELVKRLTRYVFYNFITKYTDIFCLKNERSFSHFFNKKYWHISDINV